MGGAQNVVIRTVFIFHALGTPSMAAKFARGARPAKQCNRGSSGWVYGKSLCLKCLLPGMLKPGVLAASSSLSSSEGVLPLLLVLP